MLQVDWMWGFEGMDKVKPLYGIVEEAKDYHVSIRVSYRVILCPHGFTRVSGVFSYYSLGFLDFQPFQRDE